MYNYPRFYDKFLIDGFLLKKLSVIGLWSPKTVRYNFHASNHIVCVRMFYDT